MFDSNYLLFCVGAFALILSPGPDFFYVATRAIAGGRSAGVASALGIGTGLLVHTFLAASGLTLLLLASNAAFNVVKWLGAAYLIWMGIGMLRAGDTLWNVDETRAADNWRATWRQGVLINVFNPKVALTFAGVFAGFRAP
jgi:threonine/homoserine/homoserine lactone efflux protein